MVDLFVVCERCACAHGGKEEKINRHYIGFVVCVFFFKFTITFCKYHIKWHVCCCCCCCLGKCVSLWVSQSCSLSSKWIDFHRQSNRQLRFTWINTEIKMYYFIRCVNSKMYEFLSASTRYTFVIWHPKFFLLHKRCDAQNGIWLFTFTTIESKKNSIHYSHTE